ncbi:MAG: hypothetical protein ACRDRK_07560 [Pseudonocardia sp.]
MHDLNLAAGHCGRLYVPRSGSVVAVGRIAEVGSGGRMVPGV